MMTRDTEKKVTDCPIILARSAVMAYLHHSGKDYGPPCMLCWNKSGSCIIFLLVGGGCNGVTTVTGEEGRWLRCLHMD